MVISAAVTEAPGGPFVVQDLDLGEIRSSEVVVEIAAAGICHTDLTVRGGSFPTPLPVVLGHEGAGVVERVGPAVTTVAAGDRVALSYNSCGACATCLAGRPFNCLAFFPYNFGAARPDGTTALSRGGKPVHSHFFGQSSFATKAVVPERSVARIPDSIPFEVVAPFGCGVQTGAGAVINSLRVPAGASIAVFGNGGVGLSAVMAANCVGCTTIVGIDVNPARLELARELGATHVINPSEEDPVDAVRRVTGHGVDFGLETSGATSALRQAFDGTVTGGTCGVIGAPPFGEEVSLDVNMLIAHGRTVRGIVEGDSVPANFIPRLISLWERGRLPVDRLVRTFDFDRINEAAESAERGEVVKPVLKL